MSEIPMGGPGIPLAPDAPGGPGAPGSPPGAADEILVAFAEPAEQRRLTVLVRIILAIPHAIVLYALGIASDVVALICWFAALFTGRLPDGLAGFQVGYVRWLTRFYAYVLRRMRPAARVRRGARPARRTRSSSPSPSRLSSAGSRSWCASSWPSRTRSCCMRSASPPTSLP